MIQNTPGVGRTIYPPASNKMTRGRPRSKDWKLWDSFLLIDGGDDSFIYFSWLLKDGTNRTYFYGIWPFETAVWNYVNCDSPTSINQHPGQYFNGGVRSQLFQIV